MQNHLLIRGGRVVDGTGRPAFEADVCSRGGVIAEVGPAPHPEGELRSMRTVRPCASGDATLFLTRHVRDRRDLSLERAVLELTSRQAAVFGLSRRGRVEVGALGDVTVFALEDLHRNRAVMADDLPGNAARLRRPGTVLGHQPARSS